MKQKQSVKVNNELYHELGEKWYLADDDPVALLRAESKVKNPWVKSAIAKAFPEAKPADVAILDVGCGAGFLSNYLADSGLAVTGLDISESSLEIAKTYDVTKKVTYIIGDAYSLPFPAQSFDVVCSMDFLEHVEEPGKVIQEIARVLKPGGLFVFHTFNRNLVCYLIVIKGMEWFVKNTPPHLHVLKLFIKPRELTKFCELVGFLGPEFVGIGPRLFTKAFFKMLLTGRVPESFSFKIMSSTLLGYLGTTRLK